MMFGGYSQNAIIYIIAFLLAVLLSISVHEYAHAVVAKKMGDDTAQRLGRLTLNPFSHMDTFGTISFLLFGFGWAKPVPINPLNFKEYRKGIFLTSISGIIANFAVAFFSVGAYVLISSIASPSVQFLQFLLTFLSAICWELVIVNISFAIFNLIPVAPLDGFNVLCAITKSNNRVVRFLKRYGTVILLCLLLSFALVESFVPIFNDMSIIGYIANFLITPMLNFWQFFIFGLKVM